LGLLVNILKNNIALSLGRSCIEHRAAPLPTPIG
jgi:hypothetical protein